MTASDPPSLRRELDGARVVYIQAHDAYWTTRHETETFSAWEAAAPLDRALDALLAALPPDDPERDRVVQAQASLEQDRGVVQERARLEVLRMASLIYEQRCPTPNCKAFKEVSILSRWKRPHRLLT